MKNEVTIKQLKEEGGVFIEVYHARTFVSNETGELGEMMSRREARLEGLDETYTVTCKGGFTRVELTREDGKKGVGKFNFNNRHFNRKLGLRAALGKALHQLNS